MMVIKLLMSVIIMLMIMSIMPAMIMSIHQGFVISLPYCFLNSEVQGVVKNHWSRWRMVRTSLFPQQDYISTSREQRNIT